jgi:hypothetical protein
MRRSNHWPAVAIAARSATAEALAPLNIRVNRARSPAPIPISVWMRQPKPWHTMMAEGDGGVNDKLA